MNKVSRWWNGARLLRRRDSFSAKKLPSLVRVMDDLVPRKVMREVVASSNDRRQWGVLAAAWVGVSEREFHVAAASKMGLPLEERILPPDLTIFGERARSLLTELRRGGAVVALEQGQITRVIAVDPAEVRALSLYEPGMSISIASWSEIAKALDECERMVVECERNSHYRETRRRHEISAKILDIIVKEARAHGASSVEVVTINRATRYQFKTSHGKMATGTIRAEVVQDLLGFLSTLDASVLRSEAHGELVLRSLGSPSNFRLSWGEIEDACRRGPPVHSKRDDAGESSDPSSPATSTVPFLSLSQPHSQAEDPSQAPVLVVDDNPMFCRILDRLLRREGMQPHFAENGAVALEKLKAARSILPRVIICDLHMPVMNGRELLSHLKNDDRLRSIPVVMLTSDEDVDAELQLLAGGADAFVSKARDPRVLTAQVQRLLKVRSLQEAA